MDEKTEPQAPGPLNPRDRYGIGPELTLAIERIAGGRIDLDCFYDPNQHLAPRFAYTHHEIELSPIEVRGLEVEIIARDSLNSAPWIDPKWNSLYTRRTDFSIYANSGFSGGAPRKALAKAADAAASGSRVFVVGPSNLGANYWREHGHPWAAAFAHLGRYSFEALTDIPAIPDRNLKAVKKGTRQKGNSQEVVLALLQVGGASAGQFSHVMRALGYPVSYGIQG